jgi:hypothetical protein
MARRRLTASATAAALALAAVMGCSSPDDLMSAANKDVKESLDMYLAVEDESPSDNSSSVDPDATLHVDFDRALDTDTVKTSTIKIYPSSEAGKSGAELPWAWSYDKALRRLFITPEMLNGGVSYLVTLGTGLKSAKGESLDEEYSWNFTTAKIPHGSIEINGGAEYATSTTVTLAIDANNLVSTYFYSLTESDVQNASHAWWALSGSSKTESNFLASGDKVYTLYYQFKSPKDAVSKIFSTSIILDTTAPNAPTMTSGPTTPWTASHNPSWAWTTGGNGGNGVFKYYISGTGWSGETATASYAPALADGSYTFYVRERDDAGNWSGNSATYTSVTVNAPPVAPSVTRSASVTLDSTPAWSWTSGGFGNGTFRYQLDSYSGTWTETTALTYTPESALDDGQHYLYVEERDASAEWSSYNYSSIRTTPVIPYNGGRTSSLPTLSWRGTKSATYTIQLYSGGAWTTYVTGLETNSYRVLKGTALPLGTITWRVKTVVGKVTTYVPSSSGSVMIVVE